MLFHLVLYSLFVVASFAPTPPLTPGEAGSELSAPETRALDAILELLTPQPPKPNTVTTKPETLPRPVERDSHDQSALFDHNVHGLPISSRAEQVPPRFLSILLETDTYNQPTSSRLVAGHAADETNLARTVGTHSSSFLSSADSWTSSSAPRFASFDHPRSQPSASNIENHGRQVPDELAAGPSAVLHPRPQEDTSRQALVHPVEQTSDSNRVHRPSGWFSVERQGRKLPRLSSKLHPDFRRSLAQTLSLSRQHVANLPQSFILRQSYAINPSPQLTGEFIDFFNRNPGFSGYNLVDRTEQFRKQNAYRLFPTQQVFKGGSKANAFMLPSGSILVKAHQHQSLQNVIGSPRAISLWTLQQGSDGLTDLTLRGFVGAGYGFPERFNRMNAPAYVVRSTNFGEQRLLELKSKV